MDNSLTDKLIADFSKKYSQVNFHCSLAGLKEDYDLITAFDVIEHNEDDTVFLRSIIGHAAAGASLLLTAPAFNSLFSPHDVMLRHYRRYSREGLVQVVERSGLQVVRSGYLFGSLLLCRFIMNKLSGKLAQPEVESKGLAAWNHGRVLTGFVSFCLSMENRLMLQVAKYGWRVAGLTAWVLCKK